MSFFRWTTVALLMILPACAAPAGYPPSATGRAPAAPSTPVGGQAAIEHLTTLVNRHRVRAGCPELAWMPEAARVAQAHSDDMARRNFFDHTNPDGRSPMDRLQAAGVRYQRTGENIARTSGGPDDAMRLWLNSAGHRANLEECRYTHHGLGERDGRWTHVFVTPMPGAR